MNDWCFLVLFEILGYSEGALRRDSSLGSKWKKNAILSKTKQFRAMVSIDDLYEVLHGLFKEPIIGPLKSKMDEIRRLENRHDLISFC